MSDSTANEPSFDMASQSPSSIDATIDTPPQPSSPIDATIHTPPQSSSCIDATIDSPADALPGGAAQAPTRLDGPLGLSLAAPDAVDATVDHRPRQPGDDDASELDRDSFELSDGSCQIRAETQTIVANYEVLGVLGRGGVGVVYKARQIGLNRLVALKMLLAGGHAGERELMRFRIEAEAVARLHHPNIVQVYEVGTHDGLPFFSLEFVEGGSLAQKMAGKPLPARMAAQLIEALARAMHYAHQQNILHRDLKPANIILDRNGNPKITDFGLAKRLEESDEASQTRTGTLMGTPSYMSPEQAEGRTRDIGPLSDQYALGAILYEMLTGRPPFLGATLMDTLRQVRKKEPVPPCQLQSTTPRDLEIICLKSLQKEPAKRYVNAGALADDLGRFLAGEPIRARPVSLSERGWRWCRRNPRLAALYAAVFVLVLLLGVSGSALSLRLLREQQTVARMRDQVEQRMKQATDAISGGDVRGAKNFLHWSDPRLESAAELADVRTRWHDLKDRISAYEQFKDLLDNVRFAYCYGSRSQKEQGRQSCRRLLALYDAIEERREEAAGGLPPLNAEQEQLFKEDVFDMFLMAALIESDLAQDAGTSLRQQVAQQAVDWLDRAEKVLPGTRTLYVHRSGFHDRLGHRQSADADLQRAQSIQPDSAIDRFWHAYAEHVRGEDAGRKGEAAKSRQHYRQEIAEYAALLRQRPDHFWGYFNWAAVKVQLGDLEDAIICFTACIHLRPDFPWPYNNRGTAHLRLGQYDRAIRDYSAALEQRSDYIEARTNRALAYLGQNNIDQARKDCNQALEQDPRHAPAYWHRVECSRRQKQYAESLADFVQLLDLNENKVEVYFKRAAVYEEMKRSDDALGDYDRIVALEPKNAWARYKRAGLRVARGEYQQALADYTAAIALQPRAAEPYRDRAALSWLHLKDFDAALSDWEQVIKLWPSKPEAYRCMGMIYLGQRQYHLALQELEEALSRRPDYPEALWAKAQIYLWQEKTKEALSIIQPLAQKLPPGAEETLNIRGDIYRRLGRLDEAAADYRRLIQLRPDLPEAYVSLALLLSKQGEPAKARQCLDRLVEANPQSAAAYLRRGRFLRDQGHFDEAKKDGEQAARCDAGSVLPALLQASIQAARGESEAAVAAAERVLDKAPKNNGQVLYAAVQVWSLASAAAARIGKADLARRYADRAADLLDQTLDKGFHDLIYPEHNRMIDDPALEAIRQHPQVQDLLAHK